MAAFIKLRRKILMSKFNAILPLIKLWLEEDGFNRNFFYAQSIPDKIVHLELKIKSDLIFSGSDFFIAVFKELGLDDSDFSFLNKYEGKQLKKGDVISFPNPVPLAIALSGERLALNLIQHASSIATYTNQLVQLAAAHNIKILDTRKTTPGLRILEKYAVRTGGGFNHRFDQVDTWMVKDNHKTCMGGLENAIIFFKNQGSFYTELIVEIHDLNELSIAKKLGISRYLLDNFSPEDVKKAVAIKEQNMTYEVSGGITLENISNYFIPGVDAISTSSLTNSTPRVDISLKYK